MSTYNKQSVREESERIEHEFEKLSNDGNMNNECKTLFKGMLLINKLLISIFLEKKTKKTSDN